MSEIIRLFTRDYKISFVGILNIVFKEKLDNGRKWSR